jgi:hypothetical protein
MTIESAIVAPPARGRTALLAAIALLLALAIWFWLR